jgi:hypothetical protein
VEVRVHEQLAQLVIALVSCGSMVDMNHPALTTAADVFC